MRDKEIEIVCLPEQLFLTHYVSYSEHLEGIIPLTHLCVDQDL